MQLLLLRGQNLKIQDADAWFASVQKCFGIPAGLGIMALSPNLIEFYKSNNKEKFNKNYKPKRYNELSFLLEKANQFQTTYTPNVLGIYLLSKVVEFIPNISITSQKLKKRASMMYKFIEKNHYHLLVTNPKVRSQTVLAIRYTPEGVKNVKKRAKENNIILGNGYGKWKEATLRIANFPQHTDEEFEKLKNFLKM